MARYPLFPTNFNGISNDELRELYNTIESWSALLVSELESRDVNVDATPSTNIYSVTTVTGIGRPRKGDIAYSASSGKFKGYVSLGSETSWQDLN
jgi:hypothetical protein|tara:strand:- start:334 stop:618 length:285 start_codon:yes stop_codon:yes gene_type:complete